MSNEITCKECGYENSQSSKFCNNCGTKLPLSTHIFCPSCATPNTRDRVFCDTCGTRLVPETITPEAEPPQESPPPPPANEPFSLPVRPPGETGELNPLAVPDWLRTGDMDSAKEPDASDDDPRLPAGGDDLPDWLVHDSDPEPIINAPTNISTEFYQDLLEREEDLPQPDDLFPDGDDANLPDWLSDGNDAAPMGIVDEDNASSGLTDWLSDLSDDGDEETAVSPQESDESDDVTGGLTDWLQELDDDDDPADAHAEENAAVLDNMLDQSSPAPANEEADSSDWLSELGPPQTDIFNPETDEGDANTAALPSWMDELGPVQTNLLDPNQIAQLTGALTNMPDDADIVDDEEAGADVSFTNLFETASEATETLPDWLDSAAADGESFLTDMPDDPDEPEVVAEAGSDWFTADQFVAETDLDWLEETDNLEMAAEATPDTDTAEDDFLAGDDLDWLDDETAVTETPLADADSLSDGTLDDDFLADFNFDEEPAEALASEESAPLAASDDDLDWLSDMEAIQTGELQIEPEPEEMVHDEPEMADPLADALEAAAEEQERSTTPAVEEDDWGSSVIIDESTVGEDLPDWLSQLDETGQPAEASGSESDSTDEVLPDWIASMRPSEGFFGSELPGVIPEMDLRDTLEGIPEELAGAALPDWLQDTPLDDMPSTLVAEPDTGDALEIPDWLQPGADADDEQEPETAESTPSSFADLPESSSSSRNEWSSLLEELPPLTPLAESLPKAEIPEWIEQLKPPVLTGEIPVEHDDTEESAGPLKGMQGMVPIEPVIARPHVVEPHTPYVTTAEQVQQMALLRQITQESPESVTTLATSSAYKTAVWLRLAVGALLIAAVVIGLLGPDLVATELPVPANVQGMETAVSAAAGEPVLLAIEYTPAMAAELSPQAEMLMAQLAANGSPVLITSQYAAGMAIANTLEGSDAAQMVGYLPGEGIGLRQMGDCVARRNSCEQLNGRILADDLRDDLRETKLVIILTGDRTSLVNWIEQVGSVASDVTVVAGVTQALTPLSNSYAATEQLAGLLGGTPDTVAYEQLIDQPESSQRAELNAQIIGQLLAATLMLIGLLVYGTTGFMNRRRDKNR